MKSLPSPASEWERLRLGSAVYKPVDTGYEQLFILALLALLLKSLIKTPKAFKVLPRKTSIVSFFSFPV